MHKERVSYTSLHALSYLSVIDDFQDKNGKYEERMHLLYREMTRNTRRE